MTENKPSRNEDEYFVKQDAEAIKEYRARLDAERLQTERKSHFMKCPKCGADLEEKRMGSVAVDTCTECHGMWLDAGELDLVAWGWIHLVFGVLVASTGAALVAGRRGAHADFAVRALEVARRSRTFGHVRRAGVVRLPAL